MFFLPRRNTWKMELSDSLILSFFYQPRLAHHWNPDIPEDNECLHRKRTFVFFVLLVFCLLLSLSCKGAVFLLIEAGRMAMACTCTGTEIPLTTFYHDGLDGGVGLFFLQEGKQDKDKMSMGFDTCLQIREEDTAQ